MIEEKATVAEIQSNFERYLNLVMDGHEVVVIQGGQEIGRFIPREAAASVLTDFLINTLDKR